MRWEKWRGVGVWVGRGFRCVCVCVCVCYVAGKIRPAYSPQSHLVVSTASFLLVVVIVVVVVIVIFVRGRNVIDFILPLVVAVSF